jgi:MYXO-CTERM domain-containing protein
MTKTERDIGKHRDFRVKGLGLALLLGVALSAPAFADPELRLSSGAFTVTILDNGVGDLDPSAGAIVYSGAVGGWNINSTIGTSTGPGISYLDLTSLDATSSGTTDPLIVTFSDTGFTTFTDGFLLNAFATLKAGAGTATVSGWADNSNTIFGEPGAGLIGTIGPAAGGFGSTTVAGGGIGVPLYSLTESITLTGSPATVWKSDANITATPEPADSALFGGLLLLGAAFLRRRKVA